MLSYRLVLYCDICIVFLKYFFTYGTLNLTFSHYITGQHVKTAPNLTIDTHAYSIDVMFRKEQENWDQR